MLIERILRWVVVAAGFTCIGMVIVIIGVYLGRVHARHVIPMALSMAGVIAVMVERVFNAGPMPVWEMGLLAAMLVVKVFGLFAIFNRIKSRPHVLPPTPVDSPSST